MSQKVSDKYDRKTSKFIHNDDKNERLGPKSIQTKGSMQAGVTQANGLENEIVKLIESRIALDKEEKVKSR